MSARLLVRDFSLDNPVYAGATVSIYTVDPVANVKTTTLAPVFASPVGLSSLANPLRLDASGKWVIPPYVSGPVVLTITNAQVPDHSTGIIGFAGSFRGNWAPLTTYFAGDTVVDGAAGTNSLNVYYAIGPYTSSASFANDLIAPRWLLYIDAVDAAAAAVAKQLVAAGVQVALAQASATAANNASAAALVQATQAAAAAASAQTFLAQMLANPSLLTASTGLQSDSHGNVSVVYGTIAGTAAAGIDARFGAALQPAAIPAAPGQLFGGTAVAGVLAPITLAPSLALNNNVLSTTAINTDLIFNLGLSI